MIRCRVLAAQLWAWWCAFVEEQHEPNEVDEWPPDERPWTPDHRSYRDPGPMLIEGDS